MRAIPCEDYQSRISSLMPVIWVFDRPTLQLKIIAGSGVWKINCYFKVYDWNLKPGFLLPEFLDGHIFL